MQQLLLVCGVPWCSVHVVAKQARYLEQKLKLQQREDDVDEDVDDEGQQPGDAADVKDKLWGANKRAYYQTQDEEVRAWGLLWELC